MDELITMLRRLADGLEAQQQKQRVIDFSSLTEDDKRVLEDLFNVWYEQSYRDVEKKLDSVVSRVEDAFDRLDDIPDDISDISEIGDKVDELKSDMVNVNERVDDLESKLEDLPDSDDIADIVKRVNKLDLDALADIDFDELGEALAFFRRLQKAVVGEEDRVEKSAA